MSTLSFVKYQGTGNDFVLVDDRDGLFPPENKSLIQKICHRRFGVGADGLILLAQSSVADFQMRIFNSDGSEAESCGNGLRCLVRFLEDLGISKKTYRIQTAGKVVEAGFVRGRPVIDMGVPVRIVLDSEFHLIDTGVPHAVRFVPDVDMVDVALEGAVLRAKAKSNVDFAALEADGSIRVRTFERGVEEETLSCGTGAAAVAAIAWRLYSLEMPIEIHFPGGSLEVWESGGRLHVAGPAEKVFTGSFQYPIMAP